MKSENVVDINFEKMAFLQRESFMSAINHDLKIPVLAQIRALELLVNESMGRLNVGQKEIVNLTLDSCKSMYEMLSEILSAFKYQNKDFVLDFEYINIVKFVEKYFNKSNKVIKNKNIIVKLKNDSCYSVIKADIYQLNKAFEYIVNYCVTVAIPNSKFLCDIWDSEDYIHITLSFENPYFSKEKFENVIYNHIQNRMDKVGSNLELFLAKQIISAHNGFIVSTNNKNINNYTITLPLIYVNNVQ